MSVRQGLLALLSDGPKYGAQLRAEFDAVVLCGGATLRRDLPVPGRELDGIHQAGSRAAKIVSHMLAFSRRSNRKMEASELPPLIDYLETVVPESGFLVEDRITLADLAVAAMAATRLASVLSEKLWAMGRPSAVAMSAPRSSGMLLRRLVRMLPRRSVLLWIPVMVESFPAWLGTGGADGGGRAC